MSLYPQNTYNDELAERLSINILDECERFPRYFEVETVNACNARCTFCTINDWDKRGDVIMKMEMFEKFVVEVSKHKDWVKQVCLNRDGEPTLDKHLPERVKMLKDAGIKKVTFATNGQKLTQDFCEKLLEAGLDDIMISIDGTTKEVFENIRIRLDFETVKKNTLDLVDLRNKMGHKLNIRVRMVIIPENQHQVAEFMSFWKSKLSNTDDVYAMNAHSWGNQLREEAESQVKYFADKPCISPFSTLILQVDGTIPLCGADYNAKVPLGDFPKNSLSEIWNGDEYLRVRRLHANAKRNDISMCEGCDIWDRSLAGRKKDSDREAMEIQADA
jgi:pyruvate-formate lyase-activating enzyme